MHQYLFYIGDFPIRMYGLVLCMSIFLATGVAYFLAKQDGRWHQHVLDIGIYGGFAGLIGARLWDVFFSTGITTSTTCWKFPLYGRAAWQCRAALLQACLPAFGTASAIISTGLPLPISLRHPFL